MAYKMKSFSGFKSPLRATDAGLVKAADKMSRGLEDPTSLVGEGVIGFLKGYGEALKIKAKKNLTDAIKGKKKDVPVKPTDKDMEKYSDLENYDDDNPTGKAKKAKNKKVSLNIRDLFKKKKIKNPKGSTTGTLSPEEQESFLEQYDPISNIEKSETNSPLEKSEAKTRRNKKNRRRNRERP